MRYEVADALSPFYLLPFTFSSMKCYFRKTSQLVA